MVGLPSYSLSTLSVELGAPRIRWAPLAGLLFAAVILFLGLELVAYLPRAILAGILGYLGLALLKEWVLDGRQKFAPIEYLVIPIILLTSVLAGFLQGVFVGMVAAIVLFVIKYSRTRVVRFTASGAQIMSNVDRAADDEGFLREQGESLFVMGLQGYVFFGTSSQVYQALVDRIVDPGSRVPRFVVLDFTQVSGLDASAALSFEKMIRLVSDRDAEFVLCGLGDELRHRLEAGGFGQAGREPRYLPDLDRALEWVEGQILAGSAVEAIDLGCFDQMQDYLSTGQLSMLRSYLEERQVNAGDILARQGDESDELFFMETCAGSAYIDTAHGETHRVRQSARGTIFGELGFYLGIPRTATVKTDGPGTVFVLTLDALERLQAEQPEIAAGFHHYMANLLSERLMFTTRTLQAVLM
jgi:SulP family sulfate permease